MMTNWQPIETAPKDGTWIAIWNPKYEFIPIARWVDEQSDEGIFFGWGLRDEHSSPACTVDNGFIGWDEDVEGGHMPTHWIHLQDQAK